jgi:hypothetical protein
MAGMELAQRLLGFLGTGGCCRGSPRHAGSLGTTHTSEGPLNSLLLAYWLL